MALGTELIALEDVGAMRSAGIRSSKLWVDKNRNDDARDSRPRDAGSCRIEPFVACSRKNGGIGRKRTTQSE